MKYARAKRAKILFSFVKYANLWGFCCRRRRGCLSSLIAMGHHTNILTLTILYESKNPPDVPPSFMCLTTVLCI